MIRSNKLKFLYIGIYKNATTSIHDAFIKVMQPVPRRSTGTALKPKQLHPDRDEEAIILHKSMAERHMDVKTVKRLYYDTTNAEEMKEWDDLYIWAYVRNPWDLTLSHFVFRQQTTNNVLKSIGDNPEAVENMPERMKEFKDIEFNDWVKQYSDKFVLDQNHIDQYSYLENNEGIIEVDDIYPFENIYQNFQMVTQKIGMDNIILPHKNSYGPRKDYKEIYDEESKNIIAKKFERDIDFFKYSF
jgi:hypothetical protein